MRFLIRSAGRRPVDAYRDVINCIDAVCAREGADARQVHALFRSYEKMKKELAKELKKFHEYGPRLSGKDGEGNASDMRDPAHVNGNRYRTHLGSSRHYSNDACYLQTSAATEAATTVRSQQVGRAVCHSVR